MITSLLWSDTTFGIWSGLCMEIQRIKYICCWILRIEGGDIADPWYTGNFDETYDDVLEGCRGLLQYIREHVLQ